MTAWRIRAQSRQVGALLGAVAVLIAGCTTAGESSGLRASPARHSVAASPAGRVVGPRIAGTPGPGGVKHGSGLRIAGAPRLACAPPLGAPGVDRPVAGSGLRVAASACLCCRWCACAGACCGCGPGRWPPRWWPRSHLTWQCCPHWLEPPDGDSPPIWPVCGLGCGSRACPVEPVQRAAGTVQARSPGGAAAGAG
jgi:hypothetical protein